MNCSSLILTLHYNETHTSIAPTQMLLSRFTEFTSFLLFFFVWKERITCTWLISAHWRTLELMAVTSPLSLRPWKKELFNRLANNLWSYQYQPLLICLNPTACVVDCELTLNIWSRVFGLRSFIEADWYFSQSWNIPKPDLLKNLTSLGEKNLVSSKERIPPPPPSNAANLIS